MDTELPIMENKDALDSTPTLNPQFTVTIRGWEDDKEEEARDFGQRLCQLTREISNFIDLSRLDRIVIGSDYHEALASVNGEQAPAPTPTANEYGNGAAMATNIFRGDEVWSVVVIWTPLVRAIFDHEDPNQPLALHTFVHELIHVDDTRLATTTGLNGIDLARMVASVSPHIGIVVTSGRADIDRNDLPAKASILPKPYNTIVAVATVENVIQHNNEAIARTAS
ncbi:hypothetical protein [Rhizobium ruizarguesonis]|uniref:hypothetical protein n=1 Tax=Rhizobium ruizarguesonis TaxID=2081791 RepID=UPI001FEF9E8E|nr:hypothetical protein [Rhizobium ruizarguesonis]